MSILTPVPAGSPNSMTNLTVNPTVLKTVPLFSLLSDHQLAALFPAIQHRSYPRHSFMLRAGEKSDALYIILSGRAKVVIDDGEGREVTLTTIGPSEFFGEMSVISRLREADRKIASLALMDVHGRVARLIMDLAKESNGTWIVDTGSEEMA